MEYDDTGEPRRLCWWVAQMGGGPWMLVWGASAAVVGFTLGYFHSHALFALKGWLQAGTLLGLIWYVYFTFRMARPRAWTTLSIKPDLTIDPDRNKPALHPTVENQISRRLLARIELRVWVDGDPIRSGDFYRGEHFFVIPGRLSPAGVVPLVEHVDWSEEGFVNRNLLIDFKAKWIDSLCKKGSTRKFWHVDLRSGEIAAVIDPKRRAELFEPLPDPYEPPPRRRDKRRRSNPTTEPSSSRSALPACPRLRPIMLGRGTRTSYPCSPAYYRAL